MCPDFIFPKGQFDAFFVVTQDDEAKPGAVVVAVEFFRNLEGEVYLKSIGAIQGGEIGSGGSFGYPTCIDTVVGGGVEQGCATLKDRGDHTRREGEEVH